MGKVVPLNDVKVRTGTWINIAP